MKIMYIYNAWFDMQNVLRLFRNGVGLGKSSVLLDAY